MRCCFLLILATLTLDAAPDLGPLEGWLRRQEKIRTLHADFVQQRMLPALKKPIETRGSLIMTAKGKLRWELGSPPRTLAIADGSSVTIINVRKKEARRMDADSPDARAFSVMSGEGMGKGLDAFLKIFEPIETRTVQGIYQLTTRPKPARMRREVRWVFFDIDRKTEQLRAIEMQLDDRSRIKTIFSNPRINLPVDPARFEVDLSGYELR
jgi:outer membrane lipoprotein-sorting protein